MVAIDRQSEWLGSEATVKLLMWWHGFRDKGEVHSQPRRLVEVIGLNFSAFKLRSFPRPSSLSSFHYGRSCHFETSFQPHHRSRWIRAFIIQEQYSIENLESKDGFLVETFAEACSSCTLCLATTGTSQRVSYTVHSTWMQIIREIDAHIQLYYLLWA